MSKVREETYKEEELRRTLEEINRDARGGYRDKKSRDGKPSTGTDRAAKDDRKRKERPEEGRSRRKEEEERRPRDREEEKREDRRRHRDEKDDRRRHRDDGDDRRRHKGDGEDERRRHKESDDRRRSKDDGGDRRRHKDDADQKRRHKEDGDDRRRHRDEGDEKRRHRDEKGDEKKHRREGKDDCGRHKDEKEEKRHRDEGEEKRRHRDDKDDRRRHRDREETEEERDKRKREERRKRREEEEGDERRRRRDREETEEEREKRKREERRRRKEEEDRKKKEEEEKRKREEMEQKMQEDNEEEDNYDDYEDDFENYDDDFENDESSSGTVNEKNKEMADILRAMSAENDRLSRSKNNRRDSHSSSTSGEVIPADRGSHSGQQKYFINFVSARTRQVDAAVSNRTRQRSRELLRLIHLDSTTHDMFEMGELEAYQLYMRSCGRTAANQVACQTNDDAMEREVQCEPIERRTLWTLHPPDELTAVGFSASDNDQADGRRRSSLGRLKGLQDQLAEEEATRARESEARQVLQSASLQQSLRVVLRLLEEETRPMVAAPPDGTCAQLSNGYSALTCPPELRHLPCRFTAFSPTQTNLLLTLHSHGTRGKAGPTERDVGYALVWNVTVPQEPQEVLEAPARATCAIFSPLSASLVFLGLVDGSLAVWDLREPPAWHPTDAKGRRRRAATYSTAIVHLEANHQAPVVDLRTLSSAPSTFQLASLDASGTVLLWVTTQLPGADPAGSEADFGLRPGGRVRLSRTAELRAAPLGDFLSKAFAPSFESGAFLVGSELGEVHHVGRHGARLFPRLFRPAAAAADAVVSLDLSPFQEPFFLAGYSDGAVRIFHCHHAQPLMEFSEFGAEGGLTEVCWSRSRPAVFFALDGAGGLFTWDLTRDEHRPIHRESPGGRSERKALRLALSCDYSATREGNRGRRPQAAFLFSGGDFLEVHEMAEALCVGDLDETFRVANLLNSFV